MCGHVYIVFVLYYCFQATHTFVQICIVRADSSSAREPVDPKQALGQILTLKQAHDKLKFVQKVHPQRSAPQDPKAVAVHSKRFTPRPKSCHCMDMMARIVCHSYVQRHQRSRCQLLCCVTCRESGGVAYGGSTFIAPLDFFTRK